MVSNELFPVWTSYNYWIDGDFGQLLQGVRMAALNDRQTELIRSAQEQRREWQQRQIEYNKM